MWLENEESSTLLGVRVTIRVGSISIGLVYRIT